MKSKTREELNKEIALGANRAVAALQNEANIQAAQLKTKESSKHVPYTTPLTYKQRQNNPIRKDKTYNFHSLASPTIIDPPLYAGIRKEWGQMGSSHIPAWVEVIGAIVMAAPVVALIAMMVIK